MKLLRVTVDMTLGSFIVEEGKRIVPKLTEEEKKELEGLRQQLEPYGEFLKLGDLEEDERERVFAAKQRRAVLEEKESKSEITWLPKQEEEVQSVMLVLMPDRNPIYVENMPSAWLDKLFQPQIIIDQPQILVGKASREASETRTEPRETPSQYVDDPELSKKVNKIRKIIQDIEGKPVMPGKDNFLECVDVSEDEEGVTIVMPKKWLGDDWKPINEMLGKAFGEHGLQWTTQGRESHWKIF